MHIFGIGKVVNHVKSNLVICRGLDRVRTAADTHRRKLVGRRRDPGAAGSHAEQAMDNERVPTFCFA